MPEARRFQLQRQHDASGVSGTKTVCDGVLWPDGTVTVRWRGDKPSTVNWSSLGDVIAARVHDGLTQPRWLDLRDDG